MLSEEEVKHIATLARIGLKEEEVAQYQKELSSVLDFFRELETVNTDAVESVDYSAGMHSHARQDRREDFAVSDREMLLKNVPELKNGFVKVKSVF